MIQNNETKKQSLWEIAHAREPVALQEYVTVPFTGPFTPEDALDRIGEAERQEENGEVFTLEQVMGEARQRIESYEFAHN